MPERWAMIEHPAKYSEGVLSVLRKLIPPGVVLDPFGGTGKIGQLGKQWQTISNEIEPEWAKQGYGNGCWRVITGDARMLPFPDATIPAVATSPCYGNRMADGYAPQAQKRSDAVRNTYRLKLGRELTEGNAGSMQWGQDYRALHIWVWRECARVLQPGGVLVVNCKDHIRKGEVVHVCDFHRQVILNMKGFNFVQEKKVLLCARGDQNTSRARAGGKTVIEHEEIMLFRKVEKCR